MTTTNDEFRPGNGGTARREREDRVRFAREHHRHSDFRDDLNKEPHELEREADRARASIESTLEALERRFSPGELLDQMLRVTTESGGAFGRNLVTQIRNNPVPVLVTGIGMAWLMTASDRPPARGYGYRSGYAYGDYQGAAGQYGEQTSSAMGEAYKGTVTQAGQQARATAEQARQGAHHMADRAREGAAHARDAAMGAATGARDAAMGAATGARDAAMDAYHGLADSTRASADSLREGYDYLKREQPLVLGALAVAAGALIGAMLPSTRAENRMMGEYSEAAKERLQQEAHARADQARDAAAEAAEAARDALHSQGDDRPEGQSGPGAGGAPRG